jgi:hypothetical protein
MQRKTTKRAIARALSPLPEGAQAFVDQMVQGPMTAEAIEALSAQLKKALIERALQAELGHHLTQEEPSEDGSNHRNGSSGKTVLTGDGPVRIDVPRDREGTFQPILIPKHERRFTGFDDKIIAMYARGMTVREIQAFLREQYGTEVSAEIHQLGHRRGDGGSGAVAVAPPGDDVPGGVLRCIEGEDPRGGGRAQQGRVPGAGGDA